MGGLEVDPPTLNHVGWEGWGCPDRGHAALGIWSWGSAGTVGQEGPALAGVGPCKGGMIQGWGACSGWGAVRDALGGMRVWNML